MVVYGILAAALFRGSVQLWTNEVPPVAGGSALMSLISMRKKIQQDSPAAKSLRKMPTKRIRISYPLPAVAYDTWRRLQQ